MKCLLGIVLMFCCSLNICAQQTYNDTETVAPAATDSISTNIATSMSDNTITCFNYKQTKEWKRYKVLRAVGWGAFGVGIPMTLIGLCLASAAGYSTGELVFNDAFTAGIFFTGAGLLVSSIPILITAYRYRHKATQKASISLTAIKTPMYANIGTTYTPALSLSIAF